jgi:hypothetical protein
VVIVRVNPPALTVRFGALVVDPPVVPKTTVAVAAIFRVKPPVPVKVKPVAVAIDNTPAAAVVLVSAIFPAPNAIARVLELVELNNPVLRVNPARSRVPAVNAVMLVVPTVIASASVTVIPVPLIVVLPSVLALLVTVDEVKNVGTTLVYVPPEARVRFPAMFNPDAVTEQALPVKFTFLK